VTLPLGYRYAATYAGIRKVAKNDLALIVSDAPATAAAVFTQNRVAAAPVVLSRQHLKSSGGTVSAVVVNAGNANCATRTGAKVALECCKTAAKLLKTKTDRVLPASTGVIGVELDPSLITKALPGLAGGLSPEKFDDVASAILTTDTVKKTSIAEVALKDGVVRIAGMTKGSGMIQPLMATTLGFVMTDAAIGGPALRRMLRAAVEYSYNRLSVDGDTSTNDTLLLLANGASGTKLRERDRAIFTEALTHVCQSLAIQIARDGEGAKKLITIEVAGARDEAEAARMARSIANSPLVKTAIAGSDPNWGRILAAAGYSGVDFDPSKADVYLQGTLVCRKGLAAEFSEPELKKKLDERECSIRLVLRGKGTGYTRFWTCDFTKDYIEINASYRT
jgi:glutamate N-acetyltransferase / amino-acid N-acetyltransferase